MASYSANKAKWYRRNVERRRHYVFLRNFFIFIFHVPNALKRQYLARYSHDFSFKVFESLLLSIFHFIFFCFILFLNYFCCFVHLLCYILIVFKMWNNSIVAFIIIKNYFSHCRIIIIFFYYFISSFC